MSEDAGSQDEDTSDSRVQEETFQNEGERAELGFDEADTGGAYSDEDSSDEEEADTAQADTGEDEEAETAEGSGDLSEAETAWVMGCSVGTVKTQTSRGLARLRERLESTWW